MSMARVRKYYGVPAKRGGKIIYQPNAPALSRIGKILSSDGSHLFVRFDHSCERVRLHPTWEIQYL